MLEDAVKEGKLPSNPARGIRLPKVPKQPDRIISPAKEVVLLDALPTDQDRRMVAVLLDTGLRYGESPGCTRTGSTCSGAKCTSWRC